VTTRLDWFDRSKRRTAEGVWATGIDASGSGIYTCSQGRVRRRRRRRMGEHERSLGRVPYMAEDQTTKE
jgi:hypothetical protein